MNYVDMGPDDGKKTDPFCLERTYDSHKGTDFAITDEKAMQRGVNVLAAMDGTIKKIRNGEPDRWPDDDELKKVQEERKECGNAILIDHGNNLQSLYCHLKNNSITVEPNQKVKKGDVIAQVGLSGLTQFPHIHFGIIKEGKVIDPFTGQTNTSQCGTKKGSFWNENIVLNYQPLIIHSAGFSNIIPVLENIEKDSQTNSFIQMDSELLAFWVTLFGSRTGDKITLTIKDPNGKIFTQREITQPKTRARQFYYTGRKLTNISLIEGGYTGTVKIIRKNKDGTTQEWDKTVAILVKP